MKQKKLGDILYVFTDKPYEITEDTDASIVYVQAHSKEGFEALNPDLTFKKINYNVFTVKDPEWKEYLITPDGDNSQAEPSENPVDPDPSPVDPDPINPDPDPVNPDPEPSQDPDPVIPDPNQPVLTECNFISYNTTSNEERQNGKFTYYTNTSVDGLVQITITEASENNSEDMIWLVEQQGYFISDTFVADDNEIYPIYMNVGGSPTEIGIKVISIAS